MARLSRLLLGVWFAGMLASGSAVADVFDLGQITPGPTSFRTVGAAVTPGVPFDDKFAFDVIGGDGKLGGSLASAQISPNGTDGLFDLKVQLFKWNSGSNQFDPLSGEGVGPILFFDTGVDVVPAQGGDTTVGGINHAYYLRVSGEAPTTLSGKVASYGGSIIIAAVPEPSSVLFLVAGVMFALALGRRRLNAG